MGLNHIKQYDTSAFNNTWGHLAPLKNTSYKGTVRFVCTSHSHYGCQPIIIDYDFGELSGPYIHDHLFGDVCDWNTDDFKEGVVYERQLTFRNYRFYYGKPKSILSK